MSEDASVGTVQVVLKDEVDFLEGKLDLKKLLREVSKHSKPALEVLVKLLGHADPKIQLTAATKLLEFQTQIAKDISTDQLQRLIAQVKLTAGGKRTLIPVKGNDGDDEEEDSRPVVDFTTIREIE